MYPCAQSIPTGIQKIYPPGVYLEVYACNTKRMEPTEIRRRNLAWLIEKKRFGSQRAFADLADVTPGYISNVKTGKKGFSGDYARKYEKRLGLPLYWFDFTHDYSKSIDESFAAMANIAPAPDVAGFVPELSWDEAKEWSEKIMQERETLLAQKWPCPYPHGPNTFVLRVVGDSMTTQSGPSYPDGCLIYVDPDEREVASGERVVAEVSGETDLTFKVFEQDGGRRLLRPLNRQYEVINKDFRIIGKVIAAVIR